jgi:type II secretory pathway pseudopilin PulG
MLKRNKGFTLVEVLAVITLVILIFAGGTSALISAYSFFNLENKKNRASDDIAIICNWLKKDAFQAEYVSTAGTNASFTINGVSVNYTLTGSTYRRGTKVLSDIINAVSYSVVSPNYLSVDITAVQTNPDMTLNQETGFMLRCRPTF